MKVVFFGSSRHVIPILDVLRYRYGLSLVITTEQNRSEPVIFYSITNKIKYLSVRKSADLMVPYGIEGIYDSLGIVADFGLIIPEQILYKFSMGILNIHPSLLPKYRGPTPVQNAILNGDKETGVSIIKLDKYMDHGPLMAQVKEEIRPEDTSKTLYERLFKIGANLLEEALSKYEASNIELVPQNHDHATFTKMLTKNDGYVEIKNFLTNRDFFEKMVRAYFPWPGVWTQTYLSQNTDKLKIVKFLPDKKIQVEGGSEMGYKDFLNGYPNANKDLITFLREGLK